MVLKVIEQSTTGGATGPGPLVDALVAFLWSHKRGAQPPPAAGLCCINFEAIISRTASSSWGDGW